MPASPYQYLIIAPIADQAGVLADTGFATGVPLYLIADSTPRAQTHGWTGTPFTPTQEAAIETPVTGARFTYPDTFFQQYHRVLDKGLPAATLATLGLTTNPNA